MEHKEAITLTGGDLPEPMFPGAGEYFKDTNKAAWLIWRDDDNLGEIIVDRSWNRHSGTLDRESAMMKADTIAGRVINWRFVEFAVTTGEK